MTDNKALNKSMIAEKADSLVFIETSKGGS